ncbi:MAG TPA: adenylate/guanylate cyclase domain-containing protein [Aggregicoccus sp.]|nr:adenylate/guanylate cyclase domain-containing protein [Aggregicoccus sp.]
MQGPFQSAGRRFLKRLGFSLLQAAIFGSLVGLLVLLRPARPGGDEAGRTLMSGPAAWLEGLERATYDWRARELGAHSTRSDRVVLVAIDDATLGEARQSEYPGIASHPWPREIVGGMVGRLVDEGASLVLLDLLFPELSPRACVTPGLNAAGVTDDDASFRAQLDRKPGSSLLGFAWSGDRALPPSSRLWTHRVRVGRFAGLEQAHAQVQAVLAHQRPAYALPAGDGVELWAGVSNEGEGVAFAGLLGLQGPPLVRERRAADDAHRVTPVDLMVSMTRVQVEGLDPELLPEARQLQHPVAPLLGERSGYGSVTLVPDPDGVVRGLPHLVRYVPRQGESHLLPSMPLAAAMRLAGTRRLRYAGGRLHVGERFSIPMDETGYSLVRWDAQEVGRGSRGSLRRAIPAWNVLTNLFDVREGVPPRNAHDLKDRVVVLTDTSHYATDFETTPLGAQTPGGAILGQSLANLLHSEGIRRESPLRDLLLTFGLAFLGAFLALTFSHRFRSAAGAGVYFLSLVAGAGAYLAFAWYVFVHQQLWLAVAGPLLAMGATFLATTLYAFRTEQEIRGFVHSTLGRYVSPEVAKLVRRDLSLMRPERRPMTVYFSDVEGFTRLSEQLPPEQLVAFLNEYLTEMTTVVRRNDGQVDKYIGDAVMAFWGAPVRTERHAHQACESALQMREVLLQNQDRWEKKYGHRIHFRAGINSGEVVVGNMGSQLKSNYTVMGDVVSVAARLEGANKAYGTYVLVGEATAALTRAEYVLREVDRVRVKERPQPIRVYELLTRRHELTPEQEVHLTLYGRAFEAYHARRFDEAQALFTQGMERFQDPVCAVYAERCRGYRATPPPADWDGVFAA